MNLYFLTGIIVRFLLLKMEIVHKILWVHKKCRYNGYFLILHNAKKNKMYHIFRIKFYCCAKTWASNNNIYLVHHMLNRKIQIHLFHLRNSS